MFLSFQIKYEALQIFLKLGLNTFVFEWFVQSQVLPQHVRWRPFDSEEGGGRGWGLANFLCRNIFQVYQGQNIYFHLQQNF